MLGEGRLQREGDIPDAVDSVPDPGSGHGRGSGNSEAPLQRVREREQQRRASWRQLQPRAHAHARSGSIHVRAVPRGGQRRRQLRRQHSGPGVFTLQATEPQPHPTLQSQGQAADAGRARHRRLQRLLSPLKLIPHISPNFQQRKLHNLCYLKFRFVN